MRYACLFSGQGAQHPAMLAWLASDDPRVTAVEQHLGAGWRDRLADAIWAGDNGRAQLLLTALSLGAYRAVVAVLGPAAIVAGYSVGELAAFAAAGVFDDVTALQLAAQRAACMDAAAAAAPARTGLIGLGARTPAELAALCRQHDLDLAIRLGPAQGVLGGPLPALSSAAQQAQAAGRHVTRLNVALASHTRWMQPAQSAFAQALDALPLRRPALPLASNAMGRIHTAAQARDALLRQLAETVRWDDCQDQVADQRVDLVLEIGPGNALARMWTERHPDVPARSLDEFRSLDAVVTWARRWADRG